MEFRKMLLRTDIRVDWLYSIHYFEYRSDFAFEGETHAFWELLYVDTGFLEVQAARQIHRLKRGEIIFHKPGEFHNLKALNQTTPNLFVISFHCVSPQMQYLEGLVTSIGEGDRDLLARIIVEAGKAYSTRLDNPYQNYLSPGEPSEFGSEQLIRLYLEQFLIRMIRRQKSSSEEHKPSMPSKKQTDIYIYSRVVAYMKENLSSRISISQICRDNMTGRSHLQQIFRERHSCGIMQYFIRLKIDAARHMIRQGTMNFTEIAERLGYTSIHYFSRQFKQNTKMTPSEYSASLQFTQERLLETEDADACKSASATGISR